MKKKMSIQDIANDLNVAKSTVSFILNGKAKEKRITDELTERVLKYVQEKGFKPNQIARSLSTGKTKMICLMVEKISDYFFSQIAFLLEELAYKKGYKLIYCSTENDTAKTKEMLNTMRSRYVDGYIITPPVGIEADIQELIQDNLPVVLFDRYYSSVPTDYVILDNYGGTFEAMEHLEKKACKKIAFVTLASGQTQMADRLSGYLDAVYKFHKRPMILQIPFQNNTELNTAEISEFLRNNEDIDAIIFATNYLAISGLKALNDNSLKFPDDVLIIAFDDHEIFKIYKPTISAISQPLNELAENLFKTLLDKIENRVAFSQLKQVVVPAKLELRESTQKLEHITPLINSQ